VVASKVVELVTIGDSSFVEDATDVLLNRVFGDVEKVSYFFIRHAMSHDR